MREAIAPAERTAASRQIMEHILRWGPYQRADSVMAYASVGAEVETGRLLAAILASGKQLLLPKCLGNGKMIACAIKSLAECVPGWYDILEPPSGAKEMPPQQIDLILAPGLLFDCAGNRMGQGGGYYDRFLVGYAGMTCGLAFAAQVVRQLQAQPHDQPVGALATETGIHQMGRRPDE